MDGHEEHAEAENRIWTCRSCNVLAANALRGAKLGRPTRQYNPTNTGGAANLTEWLLAVGAITPRKGERYAGSRYGIVSSMSVSDAVAMIRATPAHKRSEYAAEIAQRRRARRADAGVPF